jgi:hypothetical protein
LRAARGTGAAWGSILAGLVSVATLPVAIYLTRFSDAYELLHAGFAIPLGAALGLVALALARRANRQRNVLLGRAPRSGAATAGRALGAVGLCLAAAAVVALAVYGLLEYAGSR